MRKDYAAYLQSWWWRGLIRPLRIFWDGHRCATCHATRRLQVHHASYQHWGAWQFWREVADCVTLCSACHERLHEGRNIREFAD
jgi:hypothetical protein